MSAKKDRKRAPNREGHVYQRGSDGRWVGVVYPPKSEGGRPRYVYGRSREDAVDKRDDLKARLAAGDLTGKDMTLRQYFENVWYRRLEQEVRDGDLAESTLDSYRDNAALHILPALGSVGLRDLGRPRLRKWRADLAAAPAKRQRKTLRPGETELPPPALLSARTINYCHSILSRALGDAMEDDLLVRNVALSGRRKRRGTATTKKARVKRAPKISKAAARHLLEAASDDRLWCYWLTVLSLGLRRGEGLAIRWDDIDFEARTIKLDGTIQRIRRTDPETGERTTRLVRKEMKTDTSHDVLPFGPGLAGALRRHQREQLAERMKSRVWKDTGLAFTTTVGTAIEPRNVNREWEKVCGRAGVKAHIHDLRHAAGDYMVAEGVHQRVIQGMLRHARLSTTEIYMDVLEEVRRDAAERLDSVVTGLAAPAGKHLRDVSGGEN